MMIPLEIQTIIFFVMVKQSVYNIKLGDNNPRFAGKAHLELLTIFKCCR